MNAALTKMEFEIAHEIARQTKETQDVIAALEQETHAMEQELAYIQSQLAAPFIAAPQAGQITRVRNLPLHEPFPIETGLMQLVIAPQDDYSAKIFVPAQDAKHWGIDTEILIKFSALPASSPLFDARVAKIRNVPPTATSGDIAEIGIVLDFKGDRSDVSEQAIEAILTGAGSATISAERPASSLRRAFGPTLSEIRSYF
ncbi:unnamed protein product [Chrysoparadoxa australica]